MSQKQTAPQVLLVNPWIHDFAAYDFWAAPLGLLTLGAAPAPARDYRSLTSTASTGFTPGRLKPTRGIETDADHI